jgi:ribosome-binding factor A
MRNFDRHDRVSAELADLAAQFIQSEANTDPLITVTRATVSKDYGAATIYITTIPDSRENDALIFLKRHGSAMRDFIKRRSELKIIPRFDFAVDAGERHRQHMDEIVRKIGDENDTR